MRILHAAPEGHKAFPGAEFHEQTVEISLGPRDAFENGSVGTLTRRVAVEAVLTVTGRAGRPAKPTGQPRIPHVVELLRKAQDWRRQLDAGEVQSQAEIARKQGVTRARIAQVMALLRLAPKIQEHILSMSAMQRRPLTTERALRHIAQLGNHRDQELALCALLTIAAAHS